MVRYALIFVLSLISAGCFAVDDRRDRSSCSGISLDNLYQNYTIFDVVKYGGGLTAESSARGHLGESAIVGRDTFQVRDLVISNPTYKLTCYPVSKEGEVDENRWSSFYGLGMDRAAINVLHVYDEDDVDGEPSVNLELVDGQVWDLHDGWVYKMKAQK